MRKIRSAAVIAAGTATILGLSVMPAHAEGSRTSYIAGWRVGKTSNTWYDNNSDAVATTVTLKGCFTDSEFHSAKLTLYKSDGTSYGTKTNTCGTSSWTRPGKGTFYFKLTDFSGGSSFSAEKVEIRW
ncbi:hypothetical protein ABZ918_32405 [Streptomyces viridosporus]|uniref:hypothetical protein n=1 Tax=Streptomyces viridosporus TaxID=67581 RepID=UPI0034292794